MRLSTWLLVAQGGIAALNAALHAAGAMHLPINPWVLVGAAGVSAVGVFLQQVGNQIVPPK